MPERHLIPVDELSLCDFFDTIIEEGKKDRTLLSSALKTLKEVQETFSLYDIYMEKIGLMIK
jgi:hypothetical protein